jgi:U3 small nucleolar RNA-associated protein 14
LCNQSRDKTSRKGPVRDEDSDPEIDDNDDNSLGSEEFGDYINVLDAFDGRANDSTEETLPANHAHAESQGGLSANTDVEENYSETEEDAREEEEPDSMLSADEDVNPVNPSALEGLEKFVSSLETSKKREGDSNDANNALPRKRRVMEERTAVGIEGEFTAVASGTPVLSRSGKLFSVFSGQQLRLDDLLAPLASHSAAGLSIKKTVKILDSSRTRGAPLSAPLPQRTQDRLDREAAYEQTKTEVDKWNETMKQIKEVMLTLCHLVLADLLTRRLSISLFHCKENQQEKYPILNLRRSSR